MMPTNEVEVLKEFYAAINCNDVSSALKLLDPEIVRVEFEELPSGGTYRGLEELKTHISQGRETWAEGSCTPEDFIIEGNKVIVPVHVHVKLKNDPNWIDAHIADGFAFRNGKIIQFYSFTDKQKALAWAGAHS